MELSSDGQAQKPEELENQAIAILDRNEVETRDGRLSDQWVVRTADGRTRFFWSAGKGPTQAVKQWFRDYPRLPLHCQLSRTVDQWNNNVWRIRQLEEAEVAEFEQRLVANPESVSDLDAQLKEVGL